MEQFKYITRDAQTKATKMREALKMDSVAFERMRSGYIVDDVKQNMMELVEVSNASYQEELIQGMVEGIAGSHRHLQGEFIMALGKAMIEYGKKAHDPRSEHGIKLAQRMGEMLRFPHIEASSLDTLLPKY